ncbi:hypothetical protein BIV60_02045 [Bacillus sp. MUM 116]|uniref:hypothetical protein n=1 Tax=Bacillus sp. MUM 116 TaxID=1678002 RepID=UPI0008F5EBCB|nr:hypothetical protein BIV60_02045 [Bacillus sp. MUM 116]
MKPTQELLLKSIPSAPLSSKEIARAHLSIGLHTGEFMERAMGLYECLGFERLPDFDFDGIIVKANQLTF